MKTTPSGSSGAEQPWLVRISIQAVPWLLLFTSLLITWLVWQALGSGREASTSRLAPDLTLVGGVLLSLLTFGLTFFALSSRARSLRKITLLNARLRDHERSHREQAEMEATVEDIARSLVNASANEALLQAIVSKAAEIAGTKHAFLYQAVPGEETMLLSAAVGHFQRMIGRRIRPGEDTAGVVWQTGEPITIKPAVTKVDTGPEAAGEPEALEKLHSIAAVPLRSSGQIVGVLGVAHAREAEQSPSQREVERVQKVASLASAALSAAGATVRSPQAQTSTDTALSKQIATASAGEQQDRRTEELVRRNAQLAALNEVGHALSRLYAPSEILQLIHSMIGRVLDNRNVYIALYDEQNKQVSFPIYTVNGQPQKAATRSLGGGLTEYVIRSKAALMISVDVEGTIIRLGIARIGSSSKCLMATPMLIGDKVIGVIAVQDYERENVYDAEDAKLLATLAAQAAIAIENARLYADLEQRVEARTGELSAANAALSRARDEALDASRLKSEFLANMSHEIRTPMNAVIGMAELLAGTKVDSRQRYFIETIRQSGDTLLNIINDILDLSKLEAGKLVLETIDFKVIGVVEETAQLLAPRAREKNLSLTTFVDSKVPPLVRGDPTRLRQVLINLASNAVKFTLQGHVEITAVLESQQSDGVLLRFSVSDTGVGIPAQARDRLFQPFTQADGSTTRKFGGTGLGLSISKHLVDLMLGDIGAESADDQGSTFWFTARFERASAPADSVLTPAMASLDGLRVLVVDEDLGGLNNIQRYLESWAVQYAGARTGETALSMLQQAAGGGMPYQVVIVDEPVGNMDVFALCKAIRGDGRFTESQLVLLTAFDQQGLGHRALAAGFSAYLTKPVKQSQLFDTLSRLVYGADAGSPVESVHAVATHPAPAEPAQADAPLRLDGLILVAEDHPVNQQVALMQLKQLGIVGHAVANGREAVEAVSRTPYAVVLMDCQMPELDGYDATRIIRQNEATTGHHIAIIAMTAHALPGDREACLAAGMDDYIAKPVTMEKLREVLERWLPEHHGGVAGPPRIGSEQVVESRTGAMTRPVPSAVDSPLDPKVIEDLRRMDRGGSDDFFGKLVQSFIQESDPLITAMRDAVARGDVEAMKQSAHKLKGGCSVLGTKGLASLCMDLESLARSGSLQGAQEIVAKATDEYARVKAALEIELRDLPV